jgi:hypothetical protein
VDRTSVARNRKPLAPACSPSAPDGPRQRVNDSPDRSGRIIVGTRIRRSGRDLERKVEFLLRRDEEAQRGINDLTARVASLEQESRRRLEELRGRMEAHVSTELSTAVAEYRPARIIGTIAVAIGLALATAGNLVT